MADGGARVRFADVLVSPQAQSFCAFCTKETSKYTCPRCNVRYCSSACYKSEKHLQCSEVFYKECVMDAMNDQKGSDESKRKMLDLLKKLEEQDREAQDDLETEDLEERLREMDVNSADPEAVWSALTDQERKEFETAVKSGEISNIIDLWVPWWSNRDHSKIRKGIEEVNEEGNTGKETHSKPELVKANGCHHLPPVKWNIPSLSSLMKNSIPNPNVKFSCIDVLFSYAYIMRLHNGCPEDTLEQAAESLLQLSPVLSKDAVFESVESVLHNSLSVVQDSKDLFCSEELSHVALCDVISLIEGHVVKDGQDVNFVECAFSHLCRLFSGAKEKLKENCEMKQQDKHLHKSVWLAKKKAEFLLSWVHANTNILHSLALDIHLVHNEVSVNYRQHKEQRQELEKAWGGYKPPKKTSLITEI